MGYFCAMSESSRRSTRAPLYGASRPASPRVVAAALVTCALALGCEAERPDRPDLFLVTVDALAADRLGCFGGPREAARSLCALAGGGHLFAWAASDGWGEASAAATVLSGRFAAEHGVRDDGASFLAERFRTITERLAASGYATAAFVASPRLNRSRRLGQGFDLYDDGIPAEERRPAALARRVGDWFARRPAPRFVWIHAGGADDPAALDRLVAGLDHLLAPERPGVRDDEHRTSGSRAPGLLFTALRGEAPGARHEGRDPGAGDPGHHLGEPISWRRHRVPMLWRPPGAPRSVAPRVAYGLVSLADIAPTLAAAAGLAAEDRPSDGQAVARPLRDALETAAPHPPRRLLLSSAPTPKLRLETALEVGLATPTVLYARRTSSIDGSGQPVPTDRLQRLGARFAPLPEPPGLRDPAPRSAALEARPWRDDVLHADSPVPPLEFHLARQLRDALGPGDRPTDEDLP